MKVRHFRMAGGTIRLRENPQLVADVVAERKRREMVVAAEAARRAVIDRRAQIEECAA